MSYWPAFDWPSWNAFAKNESYGSVRNSTFVPVAASNIGMIVALNGVRAPSSKAPMTSLPPACAAALELALGATLGGTTDPPADALAAGWAVDDGEAAGPHAASTAPAAATPPTATPRRRRSRRVRYRFRMTSSLIAAVLPSGSSEGRRRDGQPSCRPVRRSRRGLGRDGPRPARQMRPSS